MQLYEISMKQSQNRFFSEAIVDERIRSWTSCVCFNVAYRLISIQKELSVAKPEPATLESNKYRS